MDTVASVSVFPHLPHSPSAPGSGIQLKTTNGSPLNTYGSRCLTLQFGSRHFEWSFLLANVSMPILWLDFLCSIISWLIFQVPASLTPAISSSSSNSSSNLYTALLSWGSSVWIPRCVSSKGFFTTDPKHSVRHTIPALPSPLFLPFAAMEAAGIIRHSSSPWASPPHMVKKPDGSWRPCGGLPQAEYSNCSW